MVKPLVIGGQKIAAGSRKSFSLEVAQLYDFTKLMLPIEVIRGTEDGPTLFVSAAIHGDELNGVEIIRRLLADKALNKIKGTLIAVPIVNVFGFNNKSRYLPDRRDLNRFFPGSADGSMAAQLAYVFMEEVVKKSTHGIDLHTAAIHRSNLPQIRGCLEDPTVMEMAQAFRVPVILNSDLREGSLREAAHNCGIPTLLYEAGEATRFNENAINIGVHGILSVMRDIGMLVRFVNPFTPRKSFIARDSHWIRAPQSGILSIHKHLGRRVKKGEILGQISDPFGRIKHDIEAKRTGIIIGQATTPLINKGEAAFHIATFEKDIALQDNVDFLINTPDGLSS
ncbi:MAG: succinylglutamate desuccinylase [Micavibrio sp.]|nr:succinylglutamate desuccinylase [Micavibrio sp.]